MIDAARSHPFETEADFQRAVTDLATRAGWSWWHTPDSRRVNEGWPDLGLLRDPVFLLRELKVDRGRVSPAQARTLNALVNSGVDARVWRPKDWVEIERVLLAPRMAAA